MMENASQKSTSTGERRKRKLSSGGKRSISQPKPDTSECFVKFQAKCTKGVRVLQDEIKQLREENERLKRTSSVVCNKSGLEEGQ